MKRIDTQAIIIGGGVTGTGILRDCVLRGINCILIEKNDFASGTTGRNHGLLHSGARYAVKDIHSAKECISENIILKKIARHCIEDTGGLYVTLPEDDSSYHLNLIDGCRKAGISCDEITVKEALEIEPNLNPAIISALHVPDATIDPFRLTASNTLDAVERGATVFTHTFVQKLIMDKSRITGAVCFDRIKNETFEIYGDIIINASGVWAQEICALASIQLSMLPSKGAMVIIDYRINNTVVNRCRPPSDGDIFVPGDTVSIIGTTSTTISYDKIDETYVGDDEINILLSEGEKLIPNVSKTRLLRAYCGIRPLVALSQAMDGRNISRGIVLIDHEQRDSISGLITTAGGKLMTYRLMAEMATDLISDKLNMDTRCVTHETPLPGSEKNISASKKIKFFTGISESIVGSTHFRHGERLHRFLGKEDNNFCLICECEMVTSGEVKYALESLHARDIVDLRRRTRLGMGPCQGTLCAYRAARLLIESGVVTETEAIKILIDFFEERWKGIRPVLWGDTLREAEFTYWIYQGLFGMGNLVKDRTRKGLGVDILDEF